MLTVLLILCSLHIWASCQFDNFVRVPGNLCSIPNKLHAFVWWAGVQSIAKLRRIKVLDLSDLCEITDDGLQALSMATSLKELTLDRCNRIRCAQN